MRGTQNWTASGHRAVNAGATLRPHHQARQPGHAVLDKAVDAACKENGGAASYINDGERNIFLLERYQGLA